MGFRKVPRTESAVEDGGNSLSYSSRKLAGYCGSPENQGLKILTKKKQLWLPRWHQKQKKKKKK